MKYEQSLIQEKQFINLIMRYKSLLSEIYQSNQNDDLKRMQKKNLIQKMSDDYKLMSSNWEKNNYQKWFSEEINNAKIAAIVTYREYVPAFIEIYEKLGNDLFKFYSLIKSLSSCKYRKRKEILKSRKILFEC